MEFNESITQEIARIAERDRCGFFEAAATFCEEQDVDIDELMKTTSAHFKERLRIAALEENKVRQCVCPKTENIFDLMFT